MKLSHIQACTAITETSDPWKTLNERIDFKKYILLKQAYVCMAGEVLTGFIIFTPEPVFARGGYLRAIGVSLFNAQARYRKKAPDIRGKGNSAPFSVPLSLCFGLQPRCAGFLP